jgi:hypothetical protein
MAAQLKDVELESQALSWPEKAKAIIISNQESYNQATGLLISIADLKKEIIDHHREPKQKAFETHKAIVAAEKRLLDPLVESETIIKRGLGAFIQEQERIRQEAQRKADEEARKREEEARLALAVEAEKHGATEETQAEILNTPMPIMRPVVAPSFQKAVGIGASAKPVYKWRVTNEALIPRKFLTIDQVKINAQVRAFGATEQIPGIEIYEDIPNISVRTARR